MSEEVRNGTGKKKILVADDDPGILQVVKMSLSSEGYEVITAASGLDALRKAVREEPDAILLDITMPDLDGIELCAKLKSKEPTAKIPVGFLTAHEDIEHYGQALKHGGVVYLTKPFKRAKLISLVGILLSKHPSSPGRWTVR